MYLYEIRHRLDRLGRLKNAVIRNPRRGQVEWLTGAIWELELELEKIGPKQIAQAQALVTRKQNRYSRGKKISENPYWFWTENERRFMEREFPKETAALAAAEALKILTE